MIRKKTAMTLIIVGPALNLQQMPKVLIAPLDAEACASKQTDACRKCLGKMDSASLFIFRGFAFNSLSENLWSIRSRISIITI